jgi:hypothetical protein
VAHYLDGLEEQVTEVGWALMRQLIVEQWRLADRALVTAYQERYGEAAVREDRYDELQVISRFGVIGSTPLNRGHAAIAIVGCSLCLGGRPGRLDAKVRPQVLQR